ncbi:MAG: enterotoxin [Verrucomicrobia bacterium]|nr:enterotoxin [Verrucomicrobiota bacterium]
MDSRLTSLSRWGILLGVLMTTAGWKTWAADIVVEYPGTPPGKGMIEYQGERVTLRNAAISMSWAVGNQGVRPASVCDHQASQKLALSGEAFQIIMADGQRYAASALLLDGKLRVAELARNSKAARLAARIPGRQVEATLRSADGRLRAVWRAILHDGANYIRQEISVTAVGQDCVIKEIVCMDEAVAGARVAGRTDGSPAVAGNLFFGCEDPHALAVGEGRVSFRLQRNAPLRKGETVTQSMVAGVAPPGQMRRAFLCYLERERAHPYRPYLHYNSWYDISWRGELFDQATSLEAIRLFGERFIKPHGVVVDGMVFDDGWDDPKTLWQFNSGFPKGFAPLVAPCKQYHTRLGVWLSPFGGYGELKKQRLQFGREQGYEINPTGFSLAGPKYYAAFKRACVDMIRKYGVNHFKFDGIAGGSYANGGAAYVLDTEAMRRLMLELRREDPAVYINLTTGSWPSPFWLRFADSIWRQGHDMKFEGKGSKQQQWLTYRDLETFRSIVGKGPLFPLSSLMTQGVAYSRHGMAGEATFNSAGFKDDVRAFFGSGTSLQELYIQPGKLTADDWAVLAEAAKWARANGDVMADAHWIGGDPRKLEIYGYASWSPRKGTVMLRNPDDQPHDFALDVGTAFELPAGAATKFMLKSPWAEDAQKPALVAEAGKPMRFTLKPFEILVFDAVPQPPAKP